MNKLPNYTLIGSSGHGKLASLPNDPNLVAIHDHDGYTDYILPDENVSETEAVDRYFELVTSTTRLESTLRYLTGENGIYFIHKSPML